MKNSYTQHIKQQMQATKQQAMRLLQWHETQFADFQYRMGCRYLQSYIPRDPDGIDMLIQSRTFWNWWKNQWLIRDNDFLQKAACLPRNTAISMYINLHDPDVLITSIYPGSAVLEDSYAQMIGNLINEQL